METNRRQYSEEFKREAVQHCLTPEKSVGKVAELMAVPVSTKNWSGKVILLAESELIYQKKYEIRVEAKRDIFEYIEIFYNRERLHSSIGYYSPEEYEKLIRVS